jgi:hypothetical protein
MAIGLDLQSFLALKIVSAAEVNTQGVYTENTVPKPVCALLILLMPRIRHCCECWISASAVTAQWATESRVQLLLID